METEYREAKLETKQKRYCVGEVALTYKTKIPFSERIKVNDSNDVAYFLRKYVYDPNSIELFESGYAIFLNRFNHVT